MAHNNAVKLKGIVKDDIYYDVVEKDGRTIQFLRFLLSVPGSREAKELRGMRILAYGTLAEYTEAHIQPGSRVQVEGHIQMRTSAKGLAIEIVAEDVDFIQHINWTRGRRKHEELKTAGLMSGVFSIPVYYAADYLGHQPELVDLAVA